MLERRRKFPRFNFAVDVEFRANGDSFSGMTKNVSRDGISFISQGCSVDVGTPLQFQIKNPQEDATIEACADIAWGKKMGDECHFGILFKDINTIDKCEILELAYAIG